MDAKKAFIYWTHPLHNKKKLQIGAHYFPHIVRLDDPNQEHWSVHFIITEENQKHAGIIELNLLIDNSESKAFFETLVPNVQFVLLEGFTEVARGYII